MALDFANGNLFIPKHMLWSSRLCLRKLKANPIQQPINIKFNPLAVFAKSIDVRNPLQQQQQQHADRTPARKIIKFNSLSIDFSRRIWGVAESCYYYFNFSQSIACCLQPFSCSFGAEDLHFLLLQQTCKPFTFSQESIVRISSRFGN